MEVGSWVQRTAYGILMYVIRQLGGEWSDAAWEWFSRFFATPVAVLDDPLVTRLVHLAVGIAMGILPVIITWSVLRDTLQRLDGSSTTPPEDLVRRALLTGAAVSGTSMTAWVLVTLAEHFRLLLAAVGLDINLLGPFFALPLGPVSTGLWITLVFVVGAILLSIQRIVLAAEFTVLLVIGPFMALGLMREGGQSGWALWLREVSSLLLTPLIQMTVLLIFLRKWGDSLGPLEVGQRVAALGFLWVLWNTPRWARHLVYSTGTAGGMASAAAGAGRLVVMRQLLRSAVKV